MAIMQKYNDKHHQHHHHYNNVKKGGMINYTARINPKPDLIIKQDEEVREKEEKIIKAFLKRFPKQKSSNYLFIHRTEIREKVEEFAFSSKSLDSDLS